MKEIKIKRIGSAERADINIKNRPFPLRGRLCVTFDGQWHHTETLFPESEVSEMCFPDEQYDFDEMQSEHFFVGAYCGDDCVGLAIFRHAWNRYLYLHDLKTNTDFRRCGIGRMLIDEGARIAAENGYSGIYAICQDNNLDACRFYLSVGFKIGGLDTRVYDKTSQAGKSDIGFYLEI